MKIRKTLVVADQKGGVGKTTLALDLAVEAESDGKTCAVFDLDPQASAAFWKDTREAQSPAVISLPPARLSQALSAASETGCDLAIIDTPPFAKDIAFEAIQHADFILIPTKPAVFDVMAVTKTLELARLYNKPAGVVLTFCPVRGKEIDDTEEALRGMGAEIIPVRIHNLIAYSRAQQTGLAAQEFEPGGKAALEIRQLYKYIRMRLYTGATDHVRPKKRASGRS